MRKLIIKAIKERPTVQLAIGFLRYEALRKLNATQFSELCHRNLHGERFDDMVDQLVKGNHD